MTDVNVKTMSKLQFFFNQFVLSMPHFPPVFFNYEIGTRLGGGLRISGLGETQEDASTVVKYQSYGRKHETFFKTKGFALEKAIDPRSETPFWNISLKFIFFNGRLYPKGTLAFKP